MPAIALVGLPHSHVSQTALLFGIPPAKRGLMSQDVGNCTGRHLDFQGSFSGSQIIKIKTVHAIYLEKCMRIYRCGEIKVDTNTHKITPYFPERTIKIMASRANGSKE